jgi:hypothetical protein
MSNLPSVLDIQTLEERLEDAMNVDEVIENPDGSKTEIPKEVKKNIQIRNVADSLTEYISEASLKLPIVESTELMFGSGDTGRQSQLYIKPEPEVSKEELRSIARDLKNILNSVFPSEFLVGITHKNTVDEDGYPDETDQFFVFLVYNTRTRGSPQPPAGQSTEVL